jgi:capsular polysaccharide biosynthesis protein
VNDPDQAIAWFRGDGLNGHGWAYDDAPAGEERAAADLTGGLVNLGFFTAALRRSAWVWCLTAVAGLLIGSALYLKYPPAYHATTTVLLTDNASQNPAVEVLTDQSLAQSEPVAAGVVRELKLPQSVTSFQAAYAVTVVTDTVLTLNVGAPSSAAAVRRASALAAAFLQYRAQSARAQEQQLFAQLDQQYNAAQQRLGTLEAQISQVPSPLITPAEKAEYDHVQTLMGQQKQIMQYVTAAKAAAKTNTNAMVTGSYVIDPATALPHSRVKGVLLYVVGGLFGGLVAGMLIVVFAALLSRRLRRRDDVAVALGASVRLSVGSLRPRRWPPPLPRQAARRERDMKRVVTYLRGAVPGSSRGPASLAVVAVDDVPVVAQVVALLAASCAAEGKQVVVADLSGGACLARLLGVSYPGIHEASRDGASLVVVVPEPEDVAPVGPVAGAAPLAVPAQPGADLAAACSPADLLLSLAVLGPAYGGDHLGTWATDAVAVVTAGRASAEKIHGVGEMIRLAGTHLDSAVLLGADDNDESTGVIDPAAHSALTGPG